MPQGLLHLCKELKALADPDKANVLRSFFKTGKGEYGEGDEFYGIPVPRLRFIARMYRDLSLDDLTMLIKSPIHEERMAALLILVAQFKAADECGRTRRYVFYLKHTRWINNWDLVDVSAYHIVGAYLEGKDKSVLETLAESKWLWDRRIAMVATFHEIKNGHSDVALSIARMHLKDRHDLMHKAVGWMLREVGKRASEDDLENFLKKHYQEMPRTMLRYAIERFPKDKRELYLQGKIV